MRVPRSWQKVLKWLMISLAGFSVSILGIIAIVYLQQDKIVSEAIDYLNEEFSGRIELEDSHISPFKHFPYVSVDIENLEIFEGKNDDSELILHINDAYVGFDIWSIITGQYIIRSMDLDDGFLKLVQHEDGSFNITNALTNKHNSGLSDSPTTEESLHLDLQSIIIKDIDFLKLNEANDILVETYINKLESTYKTYDDNLEVSLDGDLLFNLILQGDTSFLHNKHISIETAFSLDAESGMINILDAELLIEKGQFLMEGTIDIENDMDLDLHFAGRKPNFDLFLAFVPEEISPLLERYDNGGHIYFDATVRGPSINGFNPAINLDFGAAEAFVKNTNANKALNDLNFNGHFDNGEHRDASTMILTIDDFSARPETGEFTGSVKVSNFNSPDIEMKLISKFNLDFLAGFLNFDNLVDVQGDVFLELNFHDIIDLNEPEKSIEKLNESYFTRLEVKDLNFKDVNFPLAVSDVNILAVMDGHKAAIEQFEFKLGGSDIEMNGSISDLPAILHHTDILVDVVLDVKADLVDLKELTFSQNDSSSSLDEQITDFAMKLRFNSSAKAFTESKYLPEGEFFIENLMAQFKHYPHKLHDFHADIMIDENSFKVIDFTGMIDKSDFHFNGTLDNYALWFSDQPTGKTSIDFYLKSDLIQLQDLFSYSGENYVPEDYRHEEFSNLLLHGLAVLNFDQSLINTELNIDRLETRMKVHPLRFEDFSGLIIYDSSRLSVKNFGGRLGNTDFTADFTHYFNKDSTERDYLSLRAKRLDFDQLFSYNPPPSNDNTVDHDAGFNVFEIPFPRMKIDLDIDHLNYHRYKIDNFVMAARTREDHFVFLDTLRLEAAGGQLAMNGYFNGSKPKEIYFSPKLKVNNIDLDELLFKFENFGQDHLVSDNLHGKLTGDLSGKIHMHTDMIPSIEDSKLHIDFQVIDGSINDFAPFKAMSDYFADKNMANVRFDTLQNDLYLENGQLTIPAMNINSTLGYFELSGTQNVDLSMDYTMRIPMKVVTRAAFQKLFSNKSKSAAGQTDEIQYRDTARNTRFVNININGTPEDYEISIGGKPQN